jgi:hypothetical protein
MTSRALVKSPMMATLDPLLDDRPPPCRTWLGHKFEGRYDDFEGTGRALEVSGAYTPAQFKALLNTTQKRHVYVRDVCVRCGHAIERCKLAKEEATDA